MIRLEDGRFIPSILYYHRVAPDISPHVGVTPEVFERQMRFLKKLEMKGVTVSEGLEGSDPKKTCILTFDDGYLDNFEYAAPILEDLGFRATIFCLSACLGSLSAWTDDPLWRGIPLMAAEEIRELSERGFEIGSHTRSHCDLGRTSREDPLRVRREIFDSRTELEDILGKPVSAFCYPYGSLSPESVECVREAGYTSARSVRRTRIGRMYDPFMLPCRPVSGRMSPVRFSAYALASRIGM